MSIGGHQSPVSKTTTWHTPPEIIKALGTFALDPCWSPSPLPQTAEVCYDEGGLDKGWYGRVWLNPPYGRPGVIAPWMDKMAEHNHGTALIFARTETDMFFRCVWEKATAVLFLRGRLHFHRADGTRAKANAGAPSVLVAYGKKDADRLQMSNLPGFFIAVDVIDGWCGVLP
jgi:hypothetical protein